MLQAAASSAAKAILVAITSWSKLRQDMCGCQPYMSSLTLSYNCLLI